MLIKCEVFEFDMSKSAFYNVSAYIESREDFV